MTTYNQEKGPAGFPATMAWGGYRLESAIDFGLQALLPADIIKAIPIPTGCVVLGVWTKVITPSTTSGATVLVGDASDADGYITAVDAMAAAETITAPNGALVAASGKTYLAGGDILLTAGPTPPANGKVLVVAHVLRV